MTKDHRGQEMLLLEKIGDHAYRGRINKLVVTVRKDVDGEKDVWLGVVYDDDGVPVYLLPPVDELGQVAETLCEREEIECVVISDDGSAKVYKGRLQPATVPLPESTSGVVVLPPFGGFLGDSVLTRSTKLIQKIEYARVGRRTGSIVFDDDWHAATGIEPAAVLMRIFHASPEDAYRLGYERDEP